MVGRDARAILRALLAAAERRTAIAPPSGADDDLLAIARKHRLSPLLSTLDPSGLDEAVMHQLRRDRVITVARNMLPAAAPHTCVRAPAAASVAVLRLNGLTHDQTLYPVPGPRTTSPVHDHVPD